MILPRRVTFRLADDSAPEEGGAVWVQVAQEGMFLGHSEGPFDLTPEIFAEFIENFHLHPSYLAGPDGVGAARVIPWDFHHTSEIKDPAIAIQGAPAQAWVLEFDVRAGDGGAGLWALTDWLEPAGGYVREGKYQWASIAFCDSYTDPVSGEVRGSYISSIALTNDPFIQGMQAMAAERGNGPDKQLDRMQWAAEDLRDMFGLSALAGLDEVTQAIATLRAIAGGSMAAPEGTDPDALIARLRSLLDLPLMSSPQEVLDHADALVAALANATPPPSPAAPTIATTAAARDKDRTMPKTLLALVTLAKIPATVTSEDEAFDALKVTLEAATGVRGQLAAILQALGVEDQDAALASIVDLVNKAAKLEEAMPQIAELRESKVAQEEDEEEEDVDEAMKAHRLDPKAKPALLAMRRGSVKLDPKADDATWRAQLEAKDAAKAKFLEEYPPPKAGEGHLGTPLATKPTDRGGYRSALGRARGGPNGVSFDPPAPPPAETDVTLAQIEACEGPNITAKAMAFVRSEAGGDKMSHDAVHARASTILRAARVR